VVGRVTTELKANESEKNEFINRFGDSTQTVFVKITILCERQGMAK